MKKKKKILIYFIHIILKKCNFKEKLHTLQKRIRKIKMFLALFKFLLKNLKNNQKKEKRIFQIH